MVSGLTSPELDRLARAHARRRHFEAVRLQWLARYLYNAMEQAVACGYVRGKAATSSKGHRLRFDVSLQKLIERAPGYDKTLAPKRRRR